MTKAKNGQKKYIMLCFYTKNSIAKKKKDKSISNLIPPFSSRKLFSEADVSRPREIEFANRLVNQRKISLKGYFLFLLFKTTSDCP